MNPARNLNQTLLSLRADVSGAKVALELSTQLSARQADDSSFTNCG